MDRKSIGKLELMSIFDLTAEQFNETLVHNNHLGFPPPINEDDTRWAASDLLDWVVGCQDKLLNLVQHISIGLEKEP